jgi:hypothetical protein
MTNGSLIDKYNLPSLTSASGVWTSEEQFEALKNTRWPGGASFSSASDLVAAGIRTDGVYNINLPTVGITPVYCLLDNKWDGGGWMMALKAKRGNTFQYGSSYWTTTNTLNPTDVTQNDGDAKYNTFNYFSAKDLMARWPDILTSGGGISGTGTWTWLENNFNNGTRQTLVSFFGTPSNRTYTSGYGGTGYFIKDAKTSSNWSGSIFSSQSDIRFYGFNYQQYNNLNSNYKARWGFGWNENGEGLFTSASNVTNIGTNDVLGGIGLGDNGLNKNYSAGDYIACCQDNTGINRAARVEIYVR